MLKQSDYDAAEAIRQDASRQAHSIRGRRGCTDHAKRAQLAKAHPAAKQQMEELQNSVQQASKNQRAKQNRTSTVSPA